MTRKTPMLVYRELTFSYPKQETQLSTPEILPTSEPTDPQISYTITESDLPVLNFQPFRKTYVAMLIVAGHCTTGATVNARFLKNGSSLYSPWLNIGANRYFTFGCFYWDVNVGDVLSCKLWSNQTDSDWRVKAFQVQITRVVPMDKIRSLFPCSFTVTTQPQLTKGNPSSTSSALNIYHADTQFSTITTSTQFDNLYVKNTYGLFRIYNGDSVGANSGYSSDAASNYPQYVANYVPTKIRFRGVRID